MTAPPALSCRELVELVTDYFEGALSAGDRVRFDEHIAVCPGCQRHLSQMRLTIAAAGRLCEDDLAPEARVELLAAFRDWRSPRANGAGAHAADGSRLDRFFRRFRR